LNLRQRAGTCGLKSPRSGSFCILNHRIFKAFSPNGIFSQVSFFSEGTLALVIYYQYRRKREGWTKRQAGGGKAGSQK
jgi:hypothetical protein